MTINEPSSNNPIFTTLSQTPPPDFWARVQYHHDKDGYLIEYDGEGYYGLCRRTGEEELHWSKVGVELAFIWHVNAWDNGNNCADRESLRRAGWLDVTYFGYSPQE